MNKIYYALALIAIIAYGLITNFVIKCDAIDESPIGYVVPADDKDLSPQASQVKAIILGKLDPAKTDIRWMYTGAAADESFEWATLTLQMKCPGVLPAVNRRTFLRDYCHISIENGKVVASN